MRWPLSPPGMTWYPLYGRQGGPPGPVWTGADTVPPAEIRSLDRPARIDDDDDDDDGDNNNNNNNNNNNKCKTATVLVSWSGLDSSMT